MKNKKGFTLVELLAVIVILGILMGVAIPAITRLISDNKTKTYINDAKKLVARAETVVNSKNTVIEKPDPGDCIVFSLGYLDDGSFDSSPYKDKDGEYMDEASFVVLKNNGGNYLYTVILVEKYNTSSYRGVKMSSLEQLSQSGYKSRVGNIETSNYDDINSFTIDDLNETKLNGFYDDTLLAAARIDGDIVDCYRYEGSESFSGSEGYQKLKTKIESIDISSSLNSENHTLLNIKTNIIPGSLNNMWVCAIVTNEESALDKDMTGNECVKEKHGGKIEQVFNTTKSNPVQFSFDKGVVSGQENFWVHIYVGKLVEKGNYSSKNEARQKKKYVLNADLPPVIEKLDIDQKNIYLNVSDDVTDKNELLVAIFNDNIDCANVNYNKTYGELFNDKKYQHNYTDDKNVYICLKDKKGNISKRGEVSFRYINPNSTPKISRFEILPNTVSSSDGVFQGNSFDTELILEVSDDYYSWNDIKISYKEVGNNNIDCNSIYNNSIKYSDFKNNKLKYRFNGNEYNGSQKTLLLCAYNPNYDPKKNNYASATAIYKIYDPVSLEDKNSFSIKSKESNYNSNEVTIKISDSFNIKTDFEDNSKIADKKIISYCYKNITQGFDQICSDRMTFSSFKEKFSNNDFYFTLKNSTQNGDKYNIGIIIYDPITNKGKEFFKEYTLYKTCSEFNRDYSYTLVDDIYTDGYDNKAITTDLCDGMCYDGYNDIKAYYFENLKKYDKYLKDENGNSLICSTPEDNKKEVGCGFYTCVGNIGDVRYNVLGNTLRTVEEKDYWDEEFEGKTYKCTGYYKLYKTTVNNDRSIAQPYNGCRMGVCKEIYEENMEYFKYNKNDTKEPYYKVDDVLNGGPFIVINDSKFADSNTCIN